LSKQASIKHRQFCGIRVHADKSNKNKEYNVELELALKK